MRYAYVKNGDVVEQAQRVLANSANSATNGPDAFISDFLHLIGTNAVLLASAHKRNAAFRAANLEAHVFRSNSGLLTLLGKTYGRAAAAIRLFVRLLKFKPNRIVCGCSDSVLLASFLISRLYSVPFVQSRHGRIIAPRGAWRERLLVSVDQWVARRALAVICHGPYLRQQLLDIGVSPERIIEFDVSYPGPQVASSEGKIVDVLRWEKTRVILFVGRIEARKGIYDLLDACKGRLRSDSEYELVYVGDGSELQRLAERIKDRSLNHRVTLLGSVPHEEVDAIIRRSRLLVTPTQSSFGEGRCMAAMEGVIAGVPVIAPNFGPFPFLVQDGVNGLLFEANSVNDLEAKITRALDDQALYEKLCQGARDTRKTLMEPPRTFGEAVECAFSMVT